MADRSLDDIIKERNFSGVGRRGRGRGQNNAARGGGGVRGRLSIQGRQQNQSNRGRGQGVAQRGVKRKIDGSFQRNSGGQNREVSLGMKGRLGNQKTVTDARQKLIAKAHQTDARQKLIQKAKLTDARARLDAKRVKSGPKKNEEVSRSSSNSGGLTRTISNEKGGKTKPLQLSVQNRSPQTQFVVQNTNSQQQFTVRNTSATNLTVRKRISPPGKSGSGEGLQVVVRNNSRENLPSSGPLSFASSQQTVATKRQPITLRLRSDSENTRVGSYGDMTAGRLQHRMGTSGPLVLNNPSRTTKSLPSVDGTRVLISNLHTTVTEEDIKELFGALGILKRVRMLKQGAAEVVYSKRESALKAISTYHNRELDGKAMQCRLDTGSVAEGAPIKKNALSDRFKTYSSDNNPTLPYRSTISASTIVELGDEIVDKVLFKLPVSSATSSKPVIFTVKI